MDPSAALFLPPPPLASCIAGTIWRDTRARDLSDADRFNYFPASPMTSVTLVARGELRLVRQPGHLAEARTAAPLPRLSVLPAQDHPTYSWSPGPVLAITVGFYPDAWAKLCGTPDAATPPQELTAALDQFAADGPSPEAWSTACAALLPLWDQCRHSGGLPDWPGSDRLSDWSRYLVSRALRTAPGHSIRTLERRLKRWTGRSRQELLRFAAVEDLHRRQVQSPETSLAGLAMDAGFSDQSHMGRAVRRTTGFSPHKLNRMIQTEEPFWCYRLLGERY